MDLSDDGITFGFFGDSICVGQGVSLYKGWVTGVARASLDLSEALAVPIKVFNASVNGRTTRQALEDMPYAVQSQSVDAIWIQYGLNDCNFWDSDFGLPRVSIGGYRENLLEMVARAQASGVKKVIVANNHPTNLNKAGSSVSGEVYEANNREYCNATLTIESEVGDDVFCVDIYNNFRKAVSESEYSLSAFLERDGLHLSEKGHQLYHDIAWPLIERILIGLASGDAVRE